MPFKTAKFDGSKNASWQIWLRIEIGWLWQSYTGYGMHFPAILSNYNGTIAYICRRFIPTTAFLVLTVFTNITLYDIAKLLNRRLGFSGNRRLGFFSTPTDKMQDLFITFQHQHPISGLFGCLKNQKIKTNFRIFQCFSTVGWASGRVSGLQKLSGEVLERLSVRRELQVICIWSSWCHCHPIISCFIKIQIGLTFLEQAYPGCLEKEAFKWVFSLHIFKHRKKIDNNCTRQL